MGLTSILSKDVNNFHNKIIAQLPFAISILRGNDFIIELANKKNLALWQKSSEEVLNKPFFEVFPSSKSNALQTILQEVYHSAIEHTQKEIPITINSETSWFDITYQPVQDDNGQTTAVMVVSMNVTEEVLARKKVKNIEKDAETFDRTVLESSPDCLKIIGKDGRIVFMNKNVQCLLELNNFGEVENKMWWELWEYDNKETVKNAVQKALLGEKVQFIAQRTTFKGTIKWLEVMVSPVSQSNGEIQELIAVSRDITEYKKTELLIQKSEEKYRGLFERMDQGFCIVEVVFDADDEPLDYRFLESNPVFKQQTGLDDVDGKTISEIVPDIEISWSQKYGHVVLTGESIR